MYADYDLHYKLFLLFCYSTYSMFVNNLHHFFNCLIKTIDYYAFKISILLIIVLPM